MTIYVDVVFLENLAMNYIILLATTIISKQNIKLIRIFIASSIGGIYAILAYIADLNLVLSLGLKIFLSIAMVHISYNTNKIKQLLKILILFYLVSFTFGGVSFMLLYFLKPQDLVSKNGVYIGMYPIKIALLGGIVGFSVIIISFKNIKSRLSTKNIFCEVEISFRNKVKKVSAMIDSGNLLKEPITGTPVIIVEKNELDGILSNDILNSIDNILNGNNDIDIGFHDINFRFIPFSSIGKESGLLLGFKPDFIKVTYENEEKYIKDIVVAIFKNRFTSNKNYTALIGIDILERSEYINGVTRKIQV